MTRPTEQLVASLGTRIDTLGGIWMGGPVMAVGAALGFEGYPWPFYMVGRGGVLGDVDPDVLASAMMFPAPALVRSAWAEGRTKLTPDEGVARFIGCAYEWANDTLADQPGLARATELLRELAESVDTAGAPLAEGWRRVAMPADDPERAVWAVQVLREQRGGLHVACVAEAGLLPVQAVMATEGEWMAKMYGWEPPYPDVESSKALKAPVEAETNRRVGATYGLDDAVLTELDELLGALTPHT